MSVFDGKSLPTPDAETLRDRFAMAALPLIIDRYGYNKKGAAAGAYEYADAMMEARK